MPARAFVVALFEDVIRLFINVVTVRLHCVCLFNLLSACVFHSVRTVLSCG